MKTSSLLGSLIAASLLGRSQPRSSIMHRTPPAKKNPSRSHRNYELARHPANRNLGAKALLQLR